MHRVTVYDDQNTVVVEVNGDLDIVAGYDLRGALAKTLRDTTRPINLDLSSVGQIDADGIESLAWCSEQAVAAHRTLTWSKCSRPLVRQIRQHHSWVRVGTQTVQRQGL